MSTTPEKTTNAKESESAAKFEKVLGKELEQIDNRRNRLDLGAPPSSEEACPLERARKRRLLGLCFSGGGIRSATFNLGVLQGLAGLGLLRFIDYLSTVSGGDYIGGWLAALVRRRGRNQIAAGYPRWPVRSRTDCFRCSVSVDRRKSCFNIGLCDSDSRRRRRQ